MNTKRYERYKANRQALDDALSALVTEVGQGAEGPHFAIGYMTGFVAEFLAHQSKAQREAFLNSVQERIKFRHSSNV